MAGALVYAALTFLISPKATLLIQLFMPMVMLVTYFFILGKPGKILPPSRKDAVVTAPSSIQVIDPPQISKGDPSVDDSRPLLGETAGEDEEERAGIAKGIKLKLRFFNKEEAGIKSKF